MQVSFFPFDILVHIELRVVTKLDSNLTRVVKVNTC